MEAQRSARLPRVKSKGLCGRFLLGRILVLLIFLLIVRGGFLSAVKFQDRSDPNLPDAPLRVRFLAVVLPAAQFAFHLDMRTLGKRFGELRELAEDDATVPFGVRDVLAILLIGGFGCQREGGDTEVRAIGARFCVAAEKADEGYFVLVHDCLRLLNFPILIGAPIKRVGHAPKCRSSAFAEVPEKSFRRSFRTRFGGKPEPAGRRSRSRRASCRRAHEKAPKRCPNKGGIHNGRHAPEQSCDQPVGCRRLPRLPLDSSWHVRRKGAMSATSVAHRKALVRPLHQGRGRTRAF